MDSNYVEMSESQPVLTNTLPLIYDKKTNWSYLEKKYRRISAKEPRFSLEFKYVSLTKRNEVQGILSIKKSFHIYSSHTRSGVFRILHKSVVKQIKEFTALVKEAQLINYPLNNISCPSTNDVLPIFKKLFGDTMKFVFLAECL